MTVDAATSSQYVSGLLLIGARYAHGLDLRHVGGDLPSRPHIAMTVAMLRARGVDIDDTAHNRWVVSPGAIQPLDVTIEPDLSNAAPFLAAAAITGGTVTVPHWPSATIQPGDAIREILQQFGAQVTYEDGTLAVTGTDEIDGVEIDLRGASELTPVVAAIAALAADTSHIRGVAHIRGHETDRLAAIETELDRLGTKVIQTDDGLTIHPRLLGGDLWHTYADHRMAQAGALLGLVVPEIVLDDVACTDKTMPEFEQLWTTMITDSVAESARRGDPAVTQVGLHGDEHEAFDRPGRRSSRPRTKDRPDYSDAEIGMVITVDRGRYRVLISDREVTATKARQLGRTGVIVGDGSGSSGTPPATRAHSPASSRSRSARRCCGVRPTTTTRTSARSWPTPTSW